MLITKHRTSLPGFPAFPDLGPHLPPSVMQHPRLLLHVYIEVVLEQSLRTSRPFVGELVPVAPQGWWVESEVPYRDRTWFRGVTAPLWCLSFVSRMWIHGMVKVVPRNRDDSPDRCARVDQRLKFHAVGMEAHIE